MKLYLTISIAILFCVGCRQKATYTPQQYCQDLKTAYTIARCKGWPDSVIIFSCGCSDIRWYDEYLLGHAHCMCDYGGDSVLYSLNPLLAEAIYKPHNP